MRAPGHRGREKLKDWVLSRPVGLNLVGVTFGSSGSIEVVWGMLAS
jgi:hypothetical protein